MFHACLVSSLICFVYTLRYFYMFSGTNLLTNAIVPAACFLLFLVPERQKINILGIGRDKSQSQYFTVGTTKSKGETERRARAASPPGRSQAWPAHGEGVGPLDASQPRLFAYKKPLLQKP